MSIFDRLAHRLSDVRGVLAEMGEALVESHRRGFVEQRSPEGEPWLALAEATRRRKQGPGILREDLVLVESITFEVTGDYDLVVGPDDSVQPPGKIAAHQRGAVGGRGSVIPARPYVGTSDAFVPELELILMNHLRGAERASPASSLIEVVPR